MQRMERGEKWEGQAVHERWGQLERERRDRVQSGSVRLFGGLTLVISGVTLLILALVKEACIHVGPPQHGCMPVMPELVAILLFLVTPFVVGTGLWLCWTAFRE